MSHIDSQKQVRNANKAHVQRSIQAGLLNVRRLLRVQMRLA